MCEYWLLVHCGPMALCASVEVVWLARLPWTEPRIPSSSTSWQCYRSSQGSVLWSSVAITQSESIFWVWLPVSFHLVSCFTTAHRFPSIELHVEHFACSCTKLCKMSKWLMCSFANMRSKVRLLSPKHLDVLTLTSTSAMNHFLAPMSTTQRDNKGGWTMPTIVIPIADASSTQCNT